MQVYNYESWPGPLPVPQAELAVFLDRDGVLNYYRSDYVRTWEQFEWIPGALDALRELGRARVRVYVVTNQSCVGRAIVEQSALDQMHQNLFAAVREHGGYINGIATCPHCPWDGCGCRKPEPGMLRGIARREEVDLGRAYVVGDSTSDVEAAVRAGCNPVLVVRRSIEGGLERRSEPNAVPPAVVTEGSLLEAVRKILLEEQLGARASLLSCERGAE